MRLHRRLAIPELLVVAVFAIVVVGAGWLLFHAMGGPGKPLVEISDGGSTNAAGWDLKINTNGSGNLHCKPGLQTYSACKNTSFKPGTFPAASLSKELAATDLKNYKDDCAYSASFGEVQTMTYHGRQTVGIDCYMQSSSSPLAQDLQKSLTKVNLGSN